MLKITRLLKHGSNVLKESFIRMNSGILSQTVQVEDKNIHFVKKGSGSSTVLLMPGALGSSKTDFGPQLEHLDGDKFTVIGWDPPGYGDSRPPDRNFENFFHEDAKMAGNLMSHLGYDKYSLLGWSDGGITALILASQMQQNVQKVVIWGSNAYICKSDIDMINQVADVTQWSPRMRKPMEDMYGDKFPSLWTQWVEAYRDIYSNNQGDICCQNLKDILAPTLVIHGMKDVMVAEEHVHHLAENIKNARKYIWEDGKHNLHLKYYKEFNQLVQDFILE